MTASQEAPSASPSASNSASSRLAALPWYALARLLGGLYILLALALLALELPGEFNDLYNGMGAIRLAGLFGQSRLFWAGYVTFTQYATIAVALSTGLFIYVRRVLPRGASDWTALLASVALVLLTLLPLGEPEFVHYPLTWLEELLVGVYLFLEVHLIFLLLNLLFIFPDGRYVPAWMRWLALEINLVWIGAFLFSYFFTDALFSFFLLNTILAIFAAFAAQIHRYRAVSTTVQRQQTKWVVFSLGMIPAFFVFLMISWAPEALLPPRWVAFGQLNIQFLIAVLIPLSIALSILRHRLWDIDLIVRRTLVYGALTLTLGGIYYLSILLSGTVLSALAGQRSPLALVLSTLLVAALFTPLRRRIQDAIDRRYYRRKYDAGVILAGFSTAARDEVDLDRITAHFLAAVDRAMHPQAMSLWLREKQPSELPSSEPP